MSIANNLTTISENIPKVYEAGKDKGWDEFWDIFQKYGARTYYPYAFHDQSWSKETLKPKYPMILSGTNDRIFYTCTFLESLNDQGIVLDTTNANSFHLVFCGCSNLKYLPILNLTSNSPAAFSRCFGNTYKLKTIEKIILRDNNYQRFNETFYNAKLLENITFEGPIGEDLSFQWSPLLTAESMKNIISCLVNYKGTDKESTKRLTFTQECWDRLETDSVSPTGGTWEDYVNQELGWLT